MAKRLKNIKVYPRISFKLCDNCEWTQKCLNGMRCESCFMKNRGPQGRCYCAWSELGTRCEHFVRRKDR